MQSLDKKLIVFPTSRAIRNYIKEESSDLLLPSFLTIDEFLKKSLFFHNKKYIDEEERFLYLKEASNIKSLEKLGISNDFMSFIKQSDYLFRFFGELSSEKVSIDDIQTNDTYDFYKEHIEILKNIYKNYNEILDKNSAVDKINLAKHYKINRSFIEKYDFIEIYFEGYFTRIEFEIIINISKIRNTRIHLSYNKYNQKSCETFFNMDFDLKLDHDYILDLSNKSIVLEKEFIVKTKNIKIESFINRINQIAFIKNSITEIISSGINAENIALVVPDESFIKSLQLFDSEKYFNYAMGKDIFNSIFYKSLFSFYSYLNEIEKKTEESISFYNIEKEFIEKYKNIWNKKVQKDSFDFLVRYLIDIETNKDIKLKVEELIYKYYNLLFKKEQKLSFKEACKILIQKVSKITLDDVNSGVITVIGLLESRAVSFDAIIICDFNENYIPKRSIKDKFLSSQIKKRAKLPVLSDRENLQKYYYYKLINGAEKVYISYVQNENNQISRFANELFDNNLLVTTPKDKEYKDILFKNRKIKHFDDDIVMDIDLSKKEWSASSLKEFLQCKRKYYLKYILSIKEHTNTLKAKGFELGNLVHNSLEELYKTYSVHDIDFDLLLSIYEKKIIENPFLLLDKEVFKKKLEKFIEYEKKRFQKNIEVIACEKNFNFLYNGIKIKGTIDRIDKIDDEYYVIDYKTSSSLKIDSKKSYENSSDFQLEFYYLACSEEFKYKNIKSFYYDLHKIELREEIVLDEKLNLLDEIFAKLNTKSVNFEKCEKVSNCQFCDFKTICDR